MLSPSERIELAISAILFVILFLFIRPILLGEKLDRRYIIITAMCFIVWTILSTSIGNQISHEDIDMNFKLNFGDLEHDKAKDKDKCKHN